MPILYALVSHGTIVLAEHSASAGAASNCTQIAHELLDKISIEKDARMTYVADAAGPSKYTFNYVVKSELVYLCLADVDFGRSLPFAFLDKIASRFEAEFGDKARRTSVPYSMNADFAPALARDVEYFSTGPGSKLKDVQEGLDKVKDVMQENISMVLDRGEKLENLMFQSETLMETSTSFSTGARRLKEQMWWNNMKIQLAVGALCFFIFFVIVANACGGMTFPECS